MNLKQKTIAIHQLKINNKLPNMKKFLLLAILAVTVQFGFSQDFTKVRNTALLKRFEDAKTEIDKLMADPKAQAKAETWYWKAAIYAELAKEPLSAKYPNAWKEADQAYKKYMEMDPTFAIVKANGADGFFTMYSTAYAAAIKEYNAKKWDEAANLFETANSYMGTIVKNKWTNMNIAFDTTAILYAAYAYTNAQKMDLAAKNYVILADSKIGGDTYQDMYKFLVLYYTNQKNEAMFKKYLATARELYPKEAWDEFEIDYMDKNMSLDEKVAVYDREDAAGTLNEMKYLQFGDVFVKAKNGDKLDSTKQAMFANKAADAFKKAYAKNPKNAIAAFNVGVMYYNMYVEYDDRYAANIRAMQALNADRPVEKDPKKKAAADAALKAKVDPIRAQNTALEKPLMDNLDLSIEWLEKSYSILKDKPTRDKTEKSVINKDVDFLANLYAYKRDRARGKDTKAYDTYDAKYKEFDALHSKF